MIPVQRPSLSRSSTNTTVLHVPLAKNHDEEACDQTPFFDDSLSDTLSAPTYKNGDDDATQERRPRRPWKCFYSSPIWLVTTLILLIVCVFQAVLHHVAPSYENGFSTDLADLTSALRLRQTRFTGSIRNWANGTMYSAQPALDTQGRRFTGTPSEDIDAAWHDLIYGRHVRFTDREVDWLRHDRGIPTITMINETTRTPANRAGHYGGPGHAAFPTLSQWHSQTHRQGILRQQIARDDVGTLRADAS